MLLCGVRVPSWAGQLEWRCDSHRVHSVSTSPRAPPATRRTSCSGLESSRGRRTRSAWWSGRWRTVTSKGCGADLGGSLDWRPKAAGAHNRPGAAHLQTGLHQPPVLDRLKWGRQHLLQRIPVFPEITQQARRFRDSHSMGHAELPFLHKRMESLVCPQALGQVHPAPDGQY